jgi:hypothetical protein
VYVDQFIRTVNASVVSGQAVILQQRTHIRYLCGGVSGTGLWFEKFLWQASNDFTASYTHIRYLSKGVSGTGYDFEKCRQHYFN